MLGASCSARTGAVARQTTTDSGGTVTVTRPSVSLRNCGVAAGHRPWNVLRGVDVANVAVLGSSLLFAATRYSRCSSASMRLNA